MATDLQGRLAKLEIEASHQECRDLIIADTVERILADSLDSACV